MDKVLIVPRWLIARPVAWFAFIATIIPVGFCIDRYCNVGTQWLLAIVVWWLLLGAISTRDRSGRILLATLVAVAAICEFLGSIVFHWYTYRLHNIPAWIPPAHGLIFYTALLWSEQRFAKSHERIIRILVTIGVTVYGVFGLLAARSDIAGACYGGLFLIWLWFTGEPRGRFYAALWLYVCYLEVCGVHLGAWHWGANVPVIKLSEGNPPSGIVGAYGLFDLTAFWLASQIEKIFAARVKPESM
jgi:hypothetical protein